MWQRIHISITWEADDDWINGIFQMIVNQTLILRK